MLFAHRKMTVMPIGPTISLLLPPLLSVVDKEDLMAVSEHSLHWSLPLPPYIICEVEKPLVTALSFTTAIKKQS